MTYKIPAIDIIDGHCVRLCKGDFTSKTQYDMSPLEMAMAYEKAGASRLHIVDLDAARGLKDNRLIIREIAQNTQLEIQVGGGIKMRQDIVDLLDIGIKRVIIGSKAQNDKPLVSSWIQEFGAEVIIIGADVNDNKIATDGWKKTSDDNIVDFMEYYLNAGARTFLCTDIAKDGMLGGTSVALYQALMDQFPKANLIASGGVGSMADIEAVEDRGLYAVVVGKAIYEGRIDIEELLA